MTLVQSVTGTVDASELGVVLPHEHVFIDRYREYGLDAYLMDLELSVREVELFKAQGGSTLVDVTTEEIGRSPALLREVSERTGVHIVMGTGHYRRPFLDLEWMDTHTADDLAKELIHDLEEGVGTTGIRAGIIGEIGSNGPHVSAVEERSFRAAARAQRATGVSITTHAVLYPVGHEQVDILRDEGVPASRIVVGHCDTVDNAAYHASLAERGVFVEFDALHQCYDRAYDLDRRVKYVVDMVRSGFGRSVLLSHDVCLRSHLYALGGRGYAFIREVFVPKLLAAGLSEEDVRQLIVENPRRALCGSDEEG